MHVAFIAQAATPNAGGGLLSFLPLILIMVVAYFLMIRPQMKRQKEQVSMLAALRKNDDVITSGGIHGRIVDINDRDNTLQIQLARGIIVTVERGSIARKFTAGAGNTEKVNLVEEKPPMAKAVSNSGVTPIGSDSTGVVTSHVGSSESYRKPRFRHRPRRSGPPKKPGETTTPES
jgi:preprotein translocase subunit YajC